jgi:predicted acyltransferase
MPAAVTDPAKPQRLVSLDLLRGLAVIGMIIVNEMAGMESPVYPLLLHSRWNGLTIADVVFPAFLFMVGVSIPLVFKRRDEVDYRGDPVAHGSTAAARLHPVEHLLAVEVRFRDVAAVRRAAAHRPCL